MISRLRMCLLAALAATAGACTSAEVAPLPPPKKVPVTTTTTLVDFSGIGLPSIPGRTTTTVVMGPGRAALTGTVVGPDGPVPGAVVLVERLVGEARATLEVQSGADGTYTVPSVLGGRYRTRAWKPAPDNLALIEPVVVFVEATEKRIVDLAVARYQGLSGAAAIAPDPPVMGSPANLVVQVVDQEVDTSGVVRGRPVVAASAQLSGTGDWLIRSPNPTVTDGDGRARWLLDCRRVGVQPLSVVVAGSAAFNLSLPECVAPPPPPEEPDPEAASTTAPATTQRSPASTTRTTAAPTATTAPRPTSTTARPTSTTS